MPAFQRVAVSSYLRKMVRSKAPTKKQQKRGVDFKKIKRKIGRKLPPPKNATNTEIKSKAIVLPEQSVASDKLGLAVSRKGLTLKELLQQSSHHNTKVRRDALTGIKELLLKNPAELRLYKLAIIEKLRERISDEDKVVRETIFQLFKSVIIPGCKEDNQGPSVSLMMAYIFNAMTHLAIDVRLMAFKFFDLLVQQFPSSFSLYTEKILQNYKDILRRNQFNLEDKGKLKSVLAGLVRCLSLLPCNKGEIESRENNNATQELPNIYELGLPNEFTGSLVLIKKLRELMPVLVNCFLECVPLVLNMTLLDGQSFDCMLHILHSIDLSVRFLVNEIDKSKQDRRFPIKSYEGPDMTMLGQEFISDLLKKLFDVFPLSPRHHLSEKDDDRYFILNVVIAKIFLQSIERIKPPAVLLEKFLDFVENMLSGKIGNTSGSVKAFQERHLVSLLPFIPKVISKVANNWKYLLLQAFTKAFQDCNPESSLKMSCLSAIEEMLIPLKSVLVLDASDPEMLSFLIMWIRELPLLLMLLGDRHPSCSKVVLQLLLRLGQCSPWNPTIEQEFEKTQFSLQEFYSKTLDDGSICYGPFVKLPRDCQDVSVVSLYYFSSLNRHMLKSIASSCLYSDLNSSTLIRILEVLDSAYRAGHIQIADFISFIITLLSKFRVSPENLYSSSVYGEKISNSGTFKAVTKLSCTCLSSMGDESLLLRLMEKLIIEQISLKPPLDNVCAMLRILTFLDSKPTKLSEQSITSLSNILLGYLVDVTFCVQEDEDESTASIHRSTSYYYLLPVIILFDRSHKLLKVAFKMMESLIAENASSTCNSMQYAKDRSSRIKAIVSFLSLLYKDVKFQHLLSSCKAEIESILQNMLLLESSEYITMTIPERNMIQGACDQLRILTSAVGNGNLTN